MKIETLFSKFNHALAWNSFLFFFHRLSKLILTFTVYTRLPTQEFATWANVFSLVFILALWFDFGLRRSIPRYCPEFAQNAAAKKRFLTRLLLCYTMILLAANLVFVASAPFIATLVRLRSAHTYFYLGCALFFIESIKSVLRLIFYAHFWQKQFNLLDTTITGLATCALIVCSLAPTVSELLLTLFYVHISASFAMVAIAMWMLKYLNQDPDYQQDSPINESQISKDFITHSGAMWLLIVVNSLTERNVLIPFFSATIGLETANLFKVANDAALFFQRFIIKVIGTPGTALLSHVESSYVQQKGVGREHLIKKALGLFHQRLLLLVFVILGLIVGLYLVWILGSSDIFFLQCMNIAATHLFLLLSLFYLAHLSMMGYSQLLSVKREYRALFMSLIPFLGLVGLMVLKPQSLLIAILAIHAIRLSSFGLRMWFAKKRFGV